jgi:hypothetical protein
MLGYIAGPLDREIYGPIHLAEPSTAVLLATRFNDREKASSRWRAGPRISAAASEEDNVSCDGADDSAPLRTIVAERGTLKEAGKGLGASRELAFTTNGDRDRGKVGIHGSSWYAGRDARNQSKQQRNQARDNARVGSSSHYDASFRASVGTVPIPLGNRGRG